MSIKPNQHDYELISPLISSEATAINDYRYAMAKATPGSPLIKLLQDIQKEEIFHIDQLIYIQHLLNGDNDYTPSDMKVKEETDALINGKEKIEYDLK